MWPSGVCGCTSTNWTGVAPYGGFATPRVQRSSRTAAGIEVVDRKVREAKRKHEAKKRANAAYELALKAKFGTIQDTEPPSEPPEAEE